MFPAALRRDGLISSAVFVTAALVAIVSARHAGVLLVPVTALLARPGGGYQVRLADRSFVQVQPGLFDDSTGSVEVSGSGLHEGLQVEVPAS